MPYFSYSHFIDAAAGKEEFAIWSRHHMTNYASAGGDRGRNGEGPRFGVEADESVWLQTCFDISHHPVWGGRDAVGFTIGATWGTPLVDFVGRRIEAS